MTTTTFLPQFIAPEPGDFINLFDSPLRPYLKLLQDDNRYLDNQGLAMDDQEYTGSSNKIALDALYIFPAASKERIDPDDIVKLNKHEEEEQLLRLPKIIRDNPRVTLLGDPGIGKSTFMQWLTLSLSYPNTNAAKEWFGELLPIVLTARKLSLPKDTKDGGKDVSPDTSPSTFIQAIIKSLGPAGNQLSEADEAFIQRLKAGQAILLVDGVDEISAETTFWLSESLKNFFKHYPRVRLILTARVVGFDSKEFWWANAKEDFEQHIIEDFTPGHVSQEEFSKDVLYTANQYKKYLTNHKSSFSTTTSADDPESWLTQQTQTLQSLEVAKQARLRLLPEKMSQEQLGKLKDYLESYFQQHPIDPVPYPHFYLAPFDIGRRNNYVQNWTKLYLPKKTEIAAFSQTLRSTCNETTYLDALSRNPVLLTMICFIQWRVGQLPNGRAELYQRIVATYLVALDRARKTEVAYTPENSAYNFDDIKLWLGKLAWQMQCDALISVTYDNADDDPHYKFKPHDLDFFLEPGRETTVYQSDLCRFFASQLTHVICTRKDIREATDGLPYKARLEAEKLIDFLKKRTGFLIPKGQGQKNEDSPIEDFFSFSHLSFQEFFTGYYLSENWSEWTKDTHTLEQLQNSLHDNSWVEVWQLAFEESSRKQQADMLNQLFGEDGDLTRSDNFFGDTLSLEKSILFAKIVMNPTIRLSLVARESHIKTLWGLIIENGIHYLGYMKRQLLNILWKDSFDSTEILIEMEPTELSLESSYSANKYAALKQLSHLKELNISNNQIDALPLLDRLPHLEELYANSAGLQNVENIKWLTNLKEVRLDNNPIKCVTPFLALPLLKTLSISGTQIMSIAGLEKLKHLEHLNIEACDIKDLSPLTQLESLNTLCMNYASHCVVDVISDLEKLNTLSADNCDIVTLPLLSKLTALTSLSMEFNEINGIQEVGHLHQLKNLYLDGNNIKDLTPLSALTQLERVSIARNPVESFAPLAQCPRLRKLIIDEEQEEQLDLSMLEEHIELDVISMDDEPW